MSSTAIPMTTAAGIGPLPDFLEEMVGLPALLRTFERSRLPLSLLDNLDMALPLSALSDLFEQAGR